MVYHYGGSEDATLLAYDSEREDVPATVEFFLVPPVRAGGEGEHLEALSREELAADASGRRLYTAAVELGDTAGLKTVIERRMGFAGRRQPVTVVLYLIPFPERLLRIRVVYPVSTPPDASSRTRALIEQVAGPSG